MWAGSRGCAHCAGAVPTMLVLCLLCQHAPGAVPSLLTSGHSQPVCSQPGEHTGSRAIPLPAPRHPVPPGPAGIPPLPPSSRGEMSASQGVKNGLERGKERKEECLGVAGDGASRGAWIWVDVRVWGCVFGGGGALAVRCVARSGAGQHQGCLRLVVMHLDGQHKWGSLVLPHMSRSASMHTGVRKHAGIFGCPQGVQDCVPGCAHTGAGFWGACRKA